MRYEVRLNAEESFYITKEEVRPMVMGTILGEKETEENARYYASCVMDELEDSGYSDIVIPGKGILYEIFRESA